MLDLEGRIRDKAAELGFCKVGFTTADDFPRVSEEAARRGYPQFFQDMIERGAHPRELFPQAESIIVLNGYLVDVALAPDELLPDCACPPGCRACVDA